MSAIVAVATSVKSTEVLKSSCEAAFNLNVDTSLQQSLLDEQSGFKAGYVPVTVSKEVSKKPMHTPQQVIAFGGIREEDVRGVRSSGRLSAQPNSDATQMERAIMTAKQRAEMPVIGKPPSKPSSIISFTDDHIVDNALSLMVSLGNSYSEGVASARLIKDVELQRTLTLLTKSDTMVHDNASCLEVTHASDLCHDLEEDGILDEETHIPLVFPNERKGRKKKNSDNKTVRRSNRVRFKNTKYQ
jgi:hypothetical protein